MNGLILVIATYIIIALLVIVLVISLIKKHSREKIEKEIEHLDKEKNIIASTPVLSELSKIETIVKNNKMEEKYKSFQRRFDVIKDKDLVNINDMIIDLDLFVEQKDIKNLRVKIAKTEMEIYKVKTKADKLLSEIKEITVSEEKYRNIIIKLKNKYRALIKEFNENEASYKDMKDVISLQFENIEKRFSNFEECMDNNEYSEVVHIVKALDTMIEHMEVLIKEMPNLVLLAEDLIPHRMNEVKTLAKNMEESGFSLDYLNLDYNIESSEKNISTILGRMKVLNLEDCMFELKTMLDYFDSIFQDFEEETQSKKKYDENVVGFENKLVKTNSMLEEMFKSTDKYKESYNLRDEDIKPLELLKDRLLDANIKYKELRNNVDTKAKPFSDLVLDLVGLTNELDILEDDIESVSKNLGSFCEDKDRAEEQQKELSALLKESKKMIASTDIPVITDNYYVELSEASDSLLEVEKELSKTHVNISVLNTRVDTARDLVLKLYNTVRQMIKYAKLVEVTIVYANRYRSNRKEIEVGLSEAEKLYYKGNYKASLDIALNTLEYISSDLKDVFIKQIDS